MRLSKLLPLRGVSNSKKGLKVPSSQFATWLILTSLLGSISAATTDVRESHLISPHRAGEPNRANGRNRIHLSRALPSTNGERSDRADKQVFRLELLRQIKAIDHMKCFPKVLCGLSVDSDKTFGINKSNFVRSYLELMRNIKPSQEGEDDQLRTEDEVEEELRWPFSPHNPDRKDHSSFERISSSAFSSSVELGDTSMDSSMEKVDRMSLPSSDGSMEAFKEKLLSSHLANGRISSSHSHHSTIGSKIPGEKKKINSDKSLTSKLTSYFTSWLPGGLQRGNDDRDESDDSSEFEMGMEDERSGANGWKLSDGALSLLPELWEKWMTTQPLRMRKGRAESSAADAGTAQKEEMVADSSEHDGDIYHTAVNIGKRLKDPKQCDYIYNGCPLEYNKILNMIGSIRTSIHPHDNTPEEVVQEFGLFTTTTTTTTTTTKKPKKKTRPSTKIMHVLPNGEKVEINFRLGGNEDSEESSSGQREYGKENVSGGGSSSETDKNSDEMVIDLGKRTGLSSEDEMSSAEKRLISRRGSPMVDTVSVKNKNSNRKKLASLIPKRNIMSERRNEEMERSEEIMIDTQEQEQLNQKKGKLKLSGLTLSTANNEEPLEISPSYVIIKHQPLSVHTTSVVQPDQHQQQYDRPQHFQLMQNGQQQVDAERITEDLKNYIRQSGGLIPKLSLRDGLITTEGDHQNPFNYNRHSDLASSISQQLQQSYANQLATLGLEAHKGGLLQLTQSQLATSPFASPFPQSPGYSNNNFAHRGPAMVGSVPGRLTSITSRPFVTSTKPTTPTTTTSTTTEKIVLPGMAETVMLDTEEITDDTVKKLESEDTVPSWMTHSPTSGESYESDSEEDDEATILENLNKALLNENKAGSKMQYKNSKKKKLKVKANSSRVRPYLSSSSEMESLKRNKGKKKTQEIHERVVIKHAGPYSGSPTVYKSPLTGPGPHGGAYPYLPHGSGRPSVFPGNPFWRFPL